MGSQIWDTAMSAKGSAEQIDSFLYVDGKTSPKIRQYNKHTIQEYRDFLDSIREDLWEEYTDIMHEINGE